MPQKESGGKKRKNERLCWMALGPRQPGADEARLEARCAQKAFFRFSLQTTIWSDAVCSARA